MKGPLWQMVGRHLNSTEEGLQVVVVMAVAIQGLTVLPWWTARPVIPHQLRHPASHIGTTSEHQIRLLLSAQSIRRAVVLLWKEKGAIT